MHDTSIFVDRCTHVVVSSPSRNEKYLAACAAGKWVLRPSFLDASASAGSLDYTFYSAHSHRQKNTFGSQLPSTRPIRTIPSILSRCRQFRCGGATRVDRRQSARPAGQPRRRPAPLAAGTSSCAFAGACTYTHSL